MRDISLHILDIAENGIRAGADLIRILIREDQEADRLEVTISDNGRGIPEEKLPEVLDPFFTTRTTRRIGLGLSLFREASRRCEGEFELRSKVGEGTEVSAAFRLGHIDLPPMGDMAGTMTVLIAGNDGVDFYYSHMVGGERFELDTRAIKKELDDVPIHHPEVIGYLTGTIRDFFRENAHRRDVNRKR